MKTERRHKLETNELADSLSHWIDSVKPYLRTVAGLIIAVLILLMIYGIVRRQAASKAQAGWDEYYEAMSTFNPDRLDSVADKFPGSPVSWWARMMIADLDFEQGCSLLFSNKPAGLEKLHSAVEGYETVCKEAREATILQRATFGLARAHESLGELKDAAADYESLVSKWPGCALAQAAQLRVKDLDRQDTKQFYDWFDKQSPGKTMAAEPGKPGEKPKFELGTVDLPPEKPKSPSSLLNSPDLQLPPVKPPTQGKPPAAGTDELPADKPSADDLPATKPAPEESTPESSSTDKSLP